MTMCRVTTLPLPNTGQGNDGDSRAAALQQFANTSAIFLEPRSVFDPAIVGIAEGEDGHRVLAYDSELVVRALADQDGWDNDVAREWYLFNIIPACCDRNSPVFLDHGGDC
jgi:hypothetical protein